MHLDVTLDDVNSGHLRDIHVKILPTRVSASSCDICYTSAARATNYKLASRALRPSPRENYLLLFSLFLLLLSSWDFGFLPVVGFWFPNIVFIIIIIIVSVIVIITVGKKYPLNPFSTLLYFTWLLLHLLQSFSVHQNHQVYLSLLSNFFFFLT